MSKLQELIRELCPDGVEYKKLRDICKLNRGTRVVRNDLSKVGEFEVYQNSLTPLGYYDKSNYPAYTAFIISAGAAGEIGFTEKPIWAADDCLCLTCPDNISSKYVYYCLLNNKLFLSSRVRKASVPRLARTAVEQFEIPVPPLPVQEEIVRILDHFTNLAAELQAELQARKEQYEYYRNKLLTFDKNVEGVKWMKLGDVCDILTGYPFDSSKFVTQGIKLMRGMNIKRGILYFNQDIDRYWENLLGVEKYLLDENDIVISMDGSLVGKSFGMVLKQYLPLLLVQRVARIRSTKVNIKYVYFYITNNFPAYVDKVKTKGAIPHISAKDIYNFLLPIPSSGKQQYIVTILDKFETLVNDLSQGLPAEIAAVQEQYEYYRNKLLSFPRLNIGA